MRFRKWRDCVRSLRQKTLSVRSRSQLLVLAAVHFLSFYGGKLLNGSRPRLNMGFPFEDRIPMLPWTVLIYFGCFLFWAVSYCIIVETEPEGTNRFLRAEIMGKVISFLFFVFLPSTIVRPEITGTGPCSFLMRLLYSVDSPECLFPSMHCYVSWMCVVGLRGKTQVPRWYRIFSAVAAVLVFLSTLTTKQHVVADVIAGLVLAELTWYISGLIETRIHYLRRERGEK